MLLVAVGNRLFAVSGAVRCRDDHGAEMIISATMNRGNPKKWSKA